MTSTGPIKQPSFPEAPLAFPEKVGPGTRGLTNALLFNGKLLVDLPGWLHPGPTDAFNAVLSLASRRSSPLRPFLGAVSHFVNLALAQGRRELKALKPLGQRIIRIHVVYPGTTESYAEWEAFHNLCLPMALAALDDPLQLSIASHEFVWRVWEYALEIGADPDDPSGVAADRVLQYFEERAKTLGGPEIMLAECSLNRYCMARRGIGSYATSSVHAVGILSVIGQTMIEEVPTDADARHESLSFYLFDRLLEPYVRRLTPAYVPRLDSLMDEHSEPLARLKEKCKRTALEIVAHPPREHQLSAVVLTALADMRVEAQEIANIDSAQMRSYVANLASDPKVWAAVSALAGSAATLPEVLTASLAVTSLSLMGAKAVASALERRKKLKDSPWSFVYYANKAR